MKHGKNGEETIITTKTKEVIIITKQQNEEERRKGINEWRDTALQTEEQSDGKKSQTDQVRRGREEELSDKEERS